MTDELLDSWRPPNFRRKSTNPHLDNDSTLEIRQAQDESERREIRNPARKRSRERNVTTDTINPKQSVSKTVDLPTTVDPRRTKQQHVESKSPKVTTSTTTFQSSAGKQAPANTPEDTRNGAASNALANAFAADYNFNQLQDKRNSLRKHLNGYKGEFNNAMQFPHSVMTDQVRGKIKKIELELETMNSDCDKASKKRNLCLQLVSEELIRASRAPTVNMDTEKMIHELQQQLKQEREDRVAQGLALETQIRDLEHQMAKQQKLQESDLITREETVKRMHSLELSLEAQTDRIHTMSEEMKSRVAQKFLKHSDLDVYIDNFEMFKANTLQRIVSIEAQSGRSVTELQPLRDAQVQTDELAKKLVTLSNAFSQYQKSNNAAVLADVDRQALDQATASVRGLNELGHQIQKLVNNVVQNNHAILALNSRYDGLTAEGLSKKVTETVGPSLEDLRNKSNATSNAIKILEIKLTDLFGQVQEAGKNVVQSITSSSDIKSQVSEITNSLNSLKQDISRHDKQLTKSNAPNNADALLTRFEELQKQVSSLNGQIHDSQGQFKAMPSIVHNNHEICLANNSKLIADVNAAKQLLEERIIALEELRSTANDFCSHMTPEVHDVAANVRADNEKSMQTPSMTTSENSNVRNAPVTSSTIANSSSTKISSEASKGKKLKKNKSKKRTRDDSGHADVVSDEQRSKKKGRNKIAGPIDLTIGTDSDSIDGLLGNEDAGERDVEDAEDAEDAESLLRKFKKPKETSSKHQAPEQKKEKTSKHRREL